MMPPSVSLEEYRAWCGTDVRRSDWVTVGQSRIDGFADTTLDRQFIHVDPERAAETMFGGTVAHGFLTLSLISVMAEQAVPKLVGAQSVVNYGLDAVRFVAPVRAGKRIRGIFRLSAIESRNQDRWLSTFDFSIEIEAGDKPAAIGRWLTLTIL